MQELLDRYGHFSPHRVSAPASPRVVALTGATGSLGAHLLTTLLDDPKIDKVICLNRGDAPAERTARALRQRRLPPPDPARVTALTADLSRPDLGLAPDTLSGVDLVIHNAWSVNFNMGVASFEPHIRATRNLLDLAFRHDARFCFISSVSAAARAGPRIPEAHLENLSDAQEMGYARSKLVAERLCREARAAGLDARVLRVGQIIGDTRHGQWNPTEAIPLMLRSAVTLGALPTLDDTLNWLPVDTVARVIVELARAVGDQAVYHVVNPHAFHWTRDLLPMLRDAGLHFEPLSPREWLDRLAASPADPAANPTIKLLEFFRAKYAEPNSRPRPFYETRLTEQASPTLHRTRSPDLSLIRKILEYWETECWRT